MANSRFVVLDTETTGLDVQEGHRVIEIGCVAVENFQVTNDVFHSYLNPECAIDSEAEKVHGLTSAFLKDKPVFSDIASDFLDFIRGSDMVIHNASFDVQFLNNELLLNGFEERIDSICSVVDSLEVARKKHSLQYNNLDALCKRYNIDTTERQKAHGALIDAKLLARVYVSMTAGEVGLFNEQDALVAQVPLSVTDSVYEREHVLIVRATEEEIAVHESYMDSLAAN